MKALTPTEEYYSWFSSAQDRDLTEWMDAMHIPKVKFDYFKGEYRQLTMRERVELYGEMRHAGLDSYEP